jgi:hypothetical protein
LKGSIPTDLLELTRDPAGNAARENWLVRHYSLLHMATHELRQFQHRDLVVPVKERAQLGIRIDQAFVRGILQPMFFNISNNSPPPLIVTMTPLGYIAPRSKGTWYFPKVYGIIAKAVQCLSMCFNSLPYLHL